MRAETRYGEAAFSFCVTIGELILVFRKKNMQVILFIMMPEKRIKLLCYCTCSDAQCILSVIHRNIQSNQIYVIPIILKCLFSFSLLAAYPPSSSHVSFPFSLEYIHVSSEQHFLPLRQTVDIAEVKLWKMELSRQWN